MPEQTSYQQLLEELERERDNIERMILWVKGRMGQHIDSPAHLSAPPADIANLPAQPRQRTWLAEDAFFRKSVPEAIKTYLNFSRRPKSAKEITAALQSGGLTHKAKNLYATVYPTLLRMERAGEIVRPKKGEWGLAEWYPPRKSSSEKANGENNGG